MEIKIQVPEEIVKAIEQAFPKLKKSVYKELIVSFINFYIGDCEGSNNNEMIGIWKQYCEISIEKIINQE